MSTGALPRRYLQRRARVVHPSATWFLWVLLTGCAATQGTGGAGPSRSPPGVQAATKKELPWLNVPSGRMKTWGGPFRLDSDVGEETLSGSI